MEMATSSAKEMFSVQTEPAKPKNVLFAKAIAFIEK